VVPVRGLGDERATVAFRVGHLLRITGYLELATVGMWTGSPRAHVMLGMAEASVRGEGPGGSDEELLRRLRALVAEARDYHAGEDFPAAMTRLRVAQDLVDLRIVALSEG
jgi:hypothetical protein